MNNETTAQKIARLRALREARDGTPDERRAERKAQEALRDKAANARFDYAMNYASDYMAKNTLGSADEAVRLLTNVNRIMRGRR